MTPPRQRATTSEAPIRWRETYRSIVELHLAPALGYQKLDPIELADVKRYVAGKRRAGLGPGRSTAT